MAQTPRCELNDELDAGYIIGMVETGEQLFLCPGHAAHFGLTLALQLLDPAEIINAAQALAATPAANGATGEAPANKPARKRAAKAKPKPATEPEPGLPETTPPADER
jgi:hypothetical protein